MDNYAMKYRRLGKTGISVSEIGFGGEWLERHEYAEGVALIKYAEGKGINIIDCWMPDPKSRSVIGDGIKDSRSRWFVQGHIGSTWKDEQYYRTRDMQYVKPAFEDLLARLQTDYVDLGMIHYVDSEDEWDRIQHSDYLDYVFELKEKGVIRHIGVSTHNPRVGIKAATCGYVEMILFSINPAFDMLPAGDTILDSMFADADAYDASLAGLDPERAEFYRLCEENDIGLTVMKPYAGGRLLDAARSPFGVAMTPVQCISYALSMGASSVLCGYDTADQIDAAVAFETAGDAEKDYASAIVGAPRHSYLGQCTYCGHCKPCPAGIDIAMVSKFYDLAAMQDAVPESIRSHYLALEHHASECIGCGGCEERCPFGVRVRERMKMAEEVFGI